MRSSLRSDERPAATPAGVLPGLVDLLGETRGQIVDRLRHGASSVAALADGLALSEVAIRRHLQVLERDGLVSARTVRRTGPGRPSAHYALTERARQLLPDNSAELADELLSYLEQTHGRSELLQFLRWRAQRHADRYAGAVSHTGPLEERAGELADVLSADGFDAGVHTVTAPDGTTHLELHQGHCAIKDVATEHPEVCAFEASVFKRLLGAKLSRRQTIAGGADTCVCHIQATTDPSPIRSDHGHES